MRARLSVRGILAAALIALAALPGARAQDKPQLKVGVGFGVGFLPFHIIESQKLFERRAAEAGMADLQVGYQKFSGSSAMQDAILSGNVDIGGYGVPALLIAWDKARASTNAIFGLAGITTTPLVLVTSNPQVRTLKDFGPKDRIAMPALVSPQMYVLQMAAEQALGPGKHNALRELVVALPHPEAVNALLSGGTEVDAYFSSPPFTSVVLRDPKVHRVVSSIDVFRGPSSFLVLGVTKRFAERNERLTKAIVAGLADAFAMIKAEPRQAAEIYLKAEPSKTLTAADIEALLRDPDNGFALAPHGVMAYAEFMHRQGELKTRPTKWQDVFLPLVHDQPGS
jgi:NitT/TauT family transport system substrate-binding protein